MQIEQKEKEKNDNAKKNIKINMSVIEKEKRVLK